jgi:prepilin-type N-terminal cleavage/methylation domain-containing protein
MVLDRTRRRQGFTLAELAIVLVVMGLLIGGILKSSQIVKGAKMRRQTDDLEGLVIACELYYESRNRFPGDRNGDGTFDNNRRVWEDLESMDLANRDHPSPYGGTYRFRFREFQGHEGNHVTIQLPAEVAAYTDRILDDGIHNSGRFRANRRYDRGGEVRVAHFVFMD